MISGSGVLSVAFIGLDEHLEKYNHPSRTPVAIPELHRTELARCCANCSCSSQTEPTPDRALVIPAISYDYAAGHQKREEPRKAYGSSKSRSDSNPVIRKERTRPIELVRLLPQIVALKKCAFSSSSRFSIGLTSKLDGP